MTWKYQNSFITSDYEGFVYIITHIASGRYYIGKKSFNSGTNWQSYYGSNRDLKADIKKHGKEAFHREILYLCKSKKQLTTFETREQFLRGVLEDDLSYNANIAGKFFRKDFLP